MKRVTKKLRLPRSAKKAGTRSDENATNLSLNLIPSLNLKRLFIKYENYRAIFT
ncbi:MAG: hypothetical protein ACLQQ4_19560 [Bacteroidia bacterium]